MKNNGGGIKINTSLRRQRNLGIRNMVKIMIQMKNARQNHRHRFQGCMWIEWKSLNFEYT